LNGCSFGVSSSSNRWSKKANSPRPSKVTTFMKRAGMIWSVSMSFPRMGMPVPEAESI
jgi:hypothetical protein